MFEKLVVEWSDKESTTIIYFYGTKVIVLLIFYIFLLILNLTVLYKKISKHREKTKNWKSNKLLDKACIVFYYFFIRNWMTFDNVRKYQFLGLLLAFCLFSEDCLTIYFYLLVLFSSLLTGLMFVFDLGFILFLSILSFSCYVRLLFSLLIGFFFIALEFDVKIICFYYLFAYYSYFFLF